MQLVHEAWKKSWRFKGNVSKYIFLKGLKKLFLFKFTKFVPKGPIDKESALVELLS